MLFIVIKSYALYFCFHKPPIYKTCMHYFCTSTYVEVITFTGKIGSDIAKYVFFKDIKTILKFRITAILAMLSVCSLLWIYTSILIIPIVIILWYKKIFIPYLFHVVGYILTILQAMLVFKALDINITIQIVKGFLVSYIAGIVSFVPFGIGIREAVMHVTLPLELHIILLASLWLRITTELFTTIIGAIWSYVWTK